MIEKRSESFANIAKLCNDYGMENNLIPRKLTSPLLDIKRPSITDRRSSQGKITRCQSIETLPEYSLVFADSSDEEIEFKKKKLLSGSLVV